MSGKHDDFLVVRKRDKLLRLEIRRLLRLRGLNRRLGGGYAFGLDRRRGGLGLLGGGLDRHRLARGLRGLLLLGHRMPEPACETQAEQYRDNLFLFVHFE